METIFIISAAFIAYAYLGYPLILWLIALARDRSVEKSEITPPVSFIIAAHNEEKRIREKIENTLALDYDKDRLEIIVASDCSDDGTDGIVKEYSGSNVRLVRSPERKGKEAAQKLAIEEASGEVLIFSDAATLLDPRGLKDMVRNFNDKTVGCVSSIDKFIDKDGKISGEGAYVRYEMLLRRLETRANTLVGLSGSFFAARRVVCLNWRTDLPGDFNTLLNSIESGMRGVLEAESIGYYRGVADEKKEYGRKVRTVLRGISTLMQNLRMLNLLKYGLFSLQVLTHKLFRWLVPFAMVSAFVSNFFLIGLSPMYASTFAVQSLFYGAALLGMLIGPASSRALFKIPYFFTAVNISVMEAWLRYLRGERMVKWEPSRR